MRASKCILLSVFFSIVLSVQGKAQQTQSQRIDSLMGKAHGRGVFNGTILIAHGDQIIYHKSWGYADAEQKKPLNRSMMFDIGSISKEFNGVSIMMLQEQHKLRLEDPISKYLSGFPSWASKVQIRHLLNYTSGMPNFTAQSDETDAQLLDSLRSLKQLK